VWRDKPTHPLYRTKAWQLIRQAALARDCYQCQRCKDKRILTRADTVHHVVPLSVDESLALDLDNLSSVCRDCHAAIHADKGGHNRPGSTRRARIITT
jgi:5-methylcytosine-specific restriction enzyme A